MPHDVSRFPSIETLLERKERLGLKFQNILRVVAGIAYALTVLFFGTGNGIEARFSLLAITVYVAGAGMILYLLPRTVRLVGLNLLGIVLDIVLLGMLALVLHATMDPAITPFSFVLKSDLFPISIFFLMFHMVSFKPQVMLLSGVLLFGFNVALLWASIAAGGTTQSFTTAFTSYRVNIDFEAGKLIVFLFIGATGYLVSRRMRQTLYDSAAAEVAATQLGRYFSPNVAGKILSSDASIMEPGGSEYEVAVLFSDIENFTTLSETLAPSEVLHFLSAYHERMLDAIFEAGGTLDKFMGDAIMATFGVPHPSCDDAARAVRAALSMNRALEQLNSERAARGLFEIRHRIGIHYGRVLAGNIGSHRQLEFTVIGDTVNTASRIEQACKQFHVRLLVSEAVVAHAQGLYDFTLQGAIEVKGKSQKVTLYTVAS